MRCRSLRRRRSPMRARTRTRAAARILRGARRSLAARGTDDGDVLMSERSKGQTLCRSLSGALALALCLGWAGQAKATELYGLVVGIDDYIGTANDLDGAVNDAQDVE